MKQYSPHTDYYFKDFITEYSNKFFEEETKNKAIQQAKNEMLLKLRQVMRIICVGFQPMLLYKESKSYSFKIGKYTAGKYGGYTFYLKYNTEEEEITEDISILIFSVGEPQLLSREIQFQPYYTKSLTKQDPNIFNTFCCFKAQYQGICTPQHHKLIMPILCHIFEV